MGQSQPKKINRVTKAQIDIACLKAKIHLELIRDRKNQEVIKGQKELVAKVKSNSRNKVEQVLIAQRVVNGLKYSQACQLLMSYAATLRSQANFLAQNMMDGKKLEPFLEMVYSLIYAAEHMGLSSLIEFKNLMRALNDPVGVEKYVNKDILNALSPSPSPEELNTYILQFSERNAIAIEAINLPGHHFTHDFKPPPPFGHSSPGSSGFSDLEKMIGQDLNQKFNPGGFGGGGQGGMGQGGMGQGGMGGFGGGGMGQGGFGGGGMGGNDFNNNPYQNLDPRGFMGNNGGNPGNTGPNVPGGGNQFVGGNNPGNIPGGANIPGGNVPSSGGHTPANLGPDFFVPVQVPSKDKGGVKQSIKDIKDIDYYPEMDANPALFNKGQVQDPDFDQICERLRKGM